MFKLFKKSKISEARLGFLKTRKGKIPTPFFMTIATVGAVKTLTSQDIRRLQAPILLGNTYHLYLKPGLSVLKKQGGLPKFMDWAGPILTDSGGFQVFSLSKIRKIKKGGVQFQSTYDGSAHFFTPKKVLKIQKVIDSDIRMVLDVCSPSKCSRKQAEKDLDLTLAWARAAKKYQAKDGSLLFGIVQGALFKDLRLQCIAELKKIGENFSAKGRPALGWDGYAVGGLAVGETNKEMYAALDYIAPALPPDKPRYLMGVGYPENIVESVKRGIDMFDCVIPTREARHGRLYFYNNKELAKTDKFYKTINITSAKFKNDSSPINPLSSFEELRHYSKAYLRHLFSINEPLALRLATLNNVEFYLALMDKIRQAIKLDRL